MATRSISRASLFGLALCAAVTITTAALVVHNRPADLKRHALAVVEAAKNGQPAPAFHPSVDWRLPIGFCIVNALALAWPGAGTRGLAVAALAAVFVVAGAVKIHDPDAFAKSITYYKMLPLEAVHPLAIVLPWWEVAAGLALLSPAWRRIGVGLILAMLAIFIVALARAAVLKLDISCGCFGHGSGGVQQGLLEDLMFVVAAVLAWRAARPRVEASAAGAWVAAAPAH
ncbi:MAG: MauE/DoxX family redox-associated membrane protein [Phycisphaerae bacterium]